MFPCPTYGCFCHRFVASHDAWHALTARPCVAACLTFSVASLSVKPVGTFASHVIFDTQAECQCAHLWSLFLAVLCASRMSGICSACLSSSNVTAFGKWESTQPPMVWREAVIAPYRTRRCVQQWLHVCMVRARLRRHGGKFLQRAGALVVT